MTGAGARGGYRPEIDGLRAIAVMAVVLDHAGVPGFSAGFLGVDIFFAISGYLITGILLRELEGRFSFAHFYVRRIRRILPALLLMALLTVPAAVLLLMPPNLADYGQSLAATALFANNVLQTLNSDYFADINDFKPLIHTWSLAVEEQYYLLVPLAMWLAWRIGKKRAIWIGVGAVSLVSFLLAHWLAQHWSEGNFFLLPSRAWELGAGGLAVLGEARLRERVMGRAAAALALLGLAMAVLPLLLFQATRLPDWPTAVPVLGTLLVLVFADQGGPAARLLSLRPIVWTGLISYSLYLFHQPIFVFARLASLDEPAPWLIPGLIPVAFACAWASWRFVEQPFRDASRVSTRTVLVTAGFGSALALGAGLGLYFSQGLARGAPEFGERAIDKAYNADVRRFASAPLPDVPGHRLLVIGDSFARDFINMGTATHRLDGYVISYGEQGRCRARPGADILRNAARADAIVLASRLSPQSLGCVAQLAATLHGKAPVLILGTKSFGWSNNVPMLLPAPQRYAFRPKPLRTEVATNEAAKSAFAGETYVDLLGMLMDSDGRVPWFTPDRKLVSSDRYHLTRAGAAYIGAILFRHPAFAALPPVAR